MGRCDVSTTTKLASHPSILYISFIFWDGRNTFYSLACKTVRTLHPVKPDELTSVCVTHQSKNSGKTKSTSKLPLPHPPPILVTVIVFASFQIFLVFPSKKNISRFFKLCVTPRKHEHDQYGSIYFFRPLFFFCCCLAAPNERDDQIYSDA